MPLATLLLTCAPWPTYLPPPNFASVSIEFDYSEIKRPVVGGAPVSLCPAGEDDGAVTPHSCGIEHLVQFGSILSESFSGQRKANTVHHLTGRPCGQTLDVK